MTFNDPRAKQAMYMGKAGRRSSRSAFTLWKIARLIIPIAIALVILWALLF